MGVAHLIRHALSMPPREAAKKVWRHAGRLVGQRLVGRIMRNQCSLPPLDQVAGPLARRLSPLPAEALAADAVEWRRLAADALAHRFDLLGAGPVLVAHGERFAGFDRHRYGPGPRPAPGQDWRRWVAERHWRGNVARARRLLDLIDDPSYRPIDWQVDFISGYRWSERTFGPSIAYGHHPGVDVKVPWELARLQHLPGMALAFGLDGDDRLRTEFRCQVLDFLGANPPGWGVNWACAMDVAIRAVNILLARDLFLAHGARLDAEFEAELGAAMLAHARHIAGHLEWNRDHRGNHYLADICGLAWIAAYLPQTTESDIFLVFAVQELAAEIDRQFTPDGANFEASTAYHRLSAEMALYTVALVLGLPAERRAAFADYDHRLWRRVPPLSPAPVAQGPVVWPPFPDATLDRLARAVRFAADVTKPSGEMVQVGDNDSGRFCKVSPHRHLDVAHLSRAGGGLFGPGGGADAEAMIVARLAGGVRVAAAGPPARRLDGVVPLAAARRVTRVTVQPADGTALAGLEPVAYPDFGLFIWRNDRAFVSVRCGPIGANGLGAHAHNDQLCVEIEIDGQAFTRDPGTFVYTPDLAARNRYRSALAHFVPRHGRQEPARLDLGPFRLEDRAQAQALCFADGVFVGVHHGFGEPVWRRVSVGAAGVVVEDCWGGPALGAATEVQEHAIRSPDQLAQLWDLDVVPSRGYGLRER